jgi:hypothetical protein
MYMILIMSWNNHEHFEKSVYHNISIENNVQHVPTSPNDTIQRMHQNQTINDVDMSIVNEIPQTMFTKNDVQCNQLMNMHFQNNRRNRLHSSIRNSSSLNENIHVEDYPLNTNVSNNLTEIFKRMTPFHKKFCAEIDKLSIVKMCHICHESYPRINVCKGFEGPIFHRCKQERGSHHFSRWNNMDPGEQPQVLLVLTQVEEIIIA